MVFVLGTCNETSHTTFVCQCSSHWHGTHCEIPVNYCRNVTCRNNGVCRALVANYTCECLGSGYSGRHCDVSSGALVLRRTISRSLGYIAIVAISLLAIFIVAMDVLRYCFGIDSIRRERRRTRRQQQIVKKRKHRVAIRYIYIDKVPSLAL